jgi:hypothetical protein
MVLLYPIEQDRPNYTHKTVTVSVQGAMKNYRINEQVYTVNHRVNIESLSEQLHIYYIYLHNSSALCFMIIVKDCSFVFLCQQKCSLEASIFRYFLLTRGVSR